MKSGVMPVASIAFTPDHYTDGRRTAAADRLVRQLAHLHENCIISIGWRKRCAVRRNAVHPASAAALAISCSLRLGQDAALPVFALAQLDLEFHRVERVARSARQNFRSRPAAEITVADLPDQVAACTLGTKRSRFAGVGRSGRAGSLVSAGSRWPTASETSPKFEDLARMAAWFGADRMRSPTTPGARITSDSPIRIPACHIICGRAVLLALGALVPQERCARENAPPPCASMKYWRISGRMNSNRKRMCPITG